MVPEYMGKDKYFQSPAPQFCETPFITLYRIFIEVLPRVSILPKQANKVLLNKRVLKLQNQNLSYPLSNLLLLVLLTTSQATKNTILCVHHMSIAITRIY